MILTPWRRFRRSSSIKQWKTPWNYMPSKKGCTWYKVNFHNMHHWLHLHILSHDNCLFISCRHIFTSLNTFQAKRLHQPASTVAASAPSSGAQSTSAPSSGAQSTSAPSTSTLFTSAPVQLPVPQLPVPYYFGTVTAVQQRGQVPMMRSL